VGDSTIPRIIGQNEDEADRKRFVGCGDVHSLETNQKVGLITQLVRNLRGYNVHDTQKTYLKYHRHHGSGASNTWEHFEELPKESFP
jgi:hypothetical protein